MAQQCAAVTASSCLLLMVFPCLPCNCWMLGQRDRKPDRYMSGDHTEESRFEPKQTQTKAITLPHLNIPVERGRTTQTPNYLLTPQVLPGCSALLLVPCMWYGCIPAALLTAGAMTTHKHMHRHPTHGQPQTPPLRDSVEDLREVTTCWNAILLLHRRPPRGYYRDES